MPQQASIGASHPPSVSLSVESTFSIGNGYDRRSENIRQNRQDWNIRDDPANHWGKQTVIPVGLRSPAQSVTEGEIRNE
jgi:hypothetical protein